NYQSQCRSLRLMALTHNIMILLLSHVFYRAVLTPFYGLTAGPAFDVAWQAPVRRLTENGTASSEGRSAAGIATARAQTTRGFAIGRLPRQFEDGFSDGYLPASRTMR
ncbi:MAG TPA: hypothetical protein VG433_09415, partial [Pirellulales bacterium]|nr:hypothetical protein [Pirellulales bacterium]